jgi:hypothetical protein
MNIYEKLMIIQQKLKAPKGQENRFGGYKYRSCEDILEAVKPLLSETKTALTISDMIEDVNGRYYIMATAKLTNCEEPGETIINTAYAREADTKKGMDDSQITGSASSYARKYALNGLFCIDDTRDADAWNTGNGTPETPKKKEPKASAQKESGTAETATKNYLKKMIVKYAYRDFGGQILKHYKVDSIDAMTPEQLATAAKQAEAYNEAHKDEPEAKENE